MKFGLEDDAFALTEKFRDFETLVTLTLNDASCDYRIESYMERFGEPFAFTLFRTYYSKGQLQELMKQEEKQPAYLYEFLKTEGLGYLAWLQDIKNDRYLDASKSLYSIADSETMLKKQSLSYSLAKLSFLEANAKEDPQRLQSGMKEIDAALDLVLTQNSIIEDFQEILKDNGTETFQNDNETCELVIKYGFSKLDEYPIRKLIIKAAASSLVNGQKAGLNAVLDLLLYRKDVADQNSFITIMELICSHEQSLQGSFEYRLHSLWRQCWLSEEWNAIRARSDSISDQEMLENLQETKIFQLISFALETNESLLLTPGDIKLEYPQDLKIVYPRLSAEQIQALSDEVQRDQSYFEKLVEDANIKQFFDQIMTLTQMVDGEDVEMD